MALTKNDIVDSIYKRLRIPKKKSTEFVESLLEIMKRALEGGENVSINRFGKFSVKNKKKRMGRNPQTGEKILLKARRVVRFTPSDILRARINRNG